MAVCFSSLSIGLIIMLGPFFSYAADPATLPSVVPNKGGGIYIVGFNKDNSTAGVATQFFVGKSVVTADVTGCPSNLLCIYCNGRDNDCQRVRVYGVQASLPGTFEADVNIEFVNNNNERVSNCPISGSGTQGGWLTIADCKWNNPPVRADLVINKWKYTPPPPSPPK